jgi:acyl-homoserine lactone acylase PvdQ
MMIRTGLAFVLGVCVGWAVWSQPVVELNVRGDTVRITRDSYGVPTVQASTQYGLLYGNGYAIAQDRLWQMEAVPSAGAGRDGRGDGQPRA